MSAPNKNFDPVSPAALDPANLQAAVDEALAAIAGAQDLAALKQVRLDHAGDRSPLALANREIGALPPQARKDAGQRVGRARGAVNQALAARQQVLEAEHEERMLIVEAVDVTLPTAIQADVIDLDTMTSGEQRTGLFFAIWGLATKLSLALATGLVFPLLALSGFVTAGTEPQPPQALAMLSALYAWLPVLPKLIAIALMWRFPISGAEQEKLRAELEAES